MLEKKAEETNIKSFKQLIKTPRKSVIARSQRQSEYIKALKENEIVETVSNSVSTVQEVLGDMMGDAPACYDCGHITIRNGSCYKCLNCGNSLGCS